MSVKCRPAVPLETATACGTPNRAHQSDSNRSTIGPQLSDGERSTSFTSAISSGRTSGADIVMFILVAWRSSPGTARESYLIFMRILVIGAGGQGLVVTDILLCAAQRGSNVEPVGLLDDNSALEGTRVLGVPVLGSFARVSDISHDALVVAIGDNRLRARLLLNFEQRGERVVAACHPDASIAAGTDLGAGCMISAGAVVAPGARIGRGALLNTNCSIDHHSVVEAFAHIGPGATLGAAVTIGECALVGLGASVMSGRRVGARAVIGAGAVVTRDVPDGVVATGVPARIHRPTR